MNPDQVLISNKLGWLRTELITEELTFEPGVRKDLHNDAVHSMTVHSHARELLKLMKKLQKQDVTIINSAI